MTPVQDILKWVKENSFDIESQSKGVVRVVSVDELHTKIDRWMIYEKVIMELIYSRGLYDGVCREDTFIELYKQIEELK